MLSQMPDVMNRKSRFHHWDNFKMSMVSNRKCQAQTYTVMYTYRIFLMAVK